LHAHPGPEERPSHGFGRATVSAGRLVGVDRGQVGRLGKPLESPRDRVRMRRLAVLPAEQDPVVEVVRAEVLTLLVEAAHAARRTPHADASARPPTARAEPKGNTWSELTSNAREHPRNA
jgi:hypothetical protein